MIYRWTMKPFTIPVSCSRNQWALNGSNGCVTKAYATSQIVSAALAAATFKAQNGSLLLAWHGPSDIHKIERVHLRCVEVTWCFAPNCNDVAYPPHDKARSLQNQNVISVISIWESIGPYLDSFLVQYVSTYTHRIHRIMWTCSCMIYQNLPHKKTPMSWSKSQRRAVTIPGPPLQVLHGEAEVKRVSLQTSPADFGVFFDTSGPISRYYTKIYQAWRLLGIYPTLTNLIWVLVLP